ncbi:hypothetical protein [Ferribacterium limneticum]|uniref:hypothetical protein n=1 Tax=Ferribacterium limneticum TaxID=76259 RepID=UPI001CF88E37|nr:hypothetical protein [Ferribacterium limneticum]UCV23852.1 hypothetical protein KI613_04795 [Ferribacterium limneticum]
MMRKIHRAALAAQLKPLLAALEPAFLPAKADVAKTLATERRFTFCADYPAGKAFLLFYPAATASDDFFTVEVAWIAAPVTTEALNAPALQMAVLSPWRDCTREDMARRPEWRLRIDDLWTDSPPQHHGSFQFSTAAARYCAQMFALHQIPTQQAREDRAFALLQECVAEEKALTDEQAAEELSPAVCLCHDAIVSAALPYFRQASDSLSIMDKPPTGTQ